MDTYDFLNHSLALPVNAIAYAVSEKLAALFPERAVVEGALVYCDVEKFAAAGLCSLRPKADVHNQFSAAWDEEYGLWKTGRNAWYDVDWDGRTLEVLVLTWSTGFHEQRFVWVIAEGEAMAEAFFSEVSAWNAEVRDEVLVFDGGCWSKSDTLFKAIKNATFDNLVLAGTLKQEILDDLSRFFVTRETYESHGVPWKRGVLFVGPPGNGKTHAVKALINALDKPCLYVKSFQAEHMTEHDCIRQVFKKARKSAPCLLVLEDLDSLINQRRQPLVLPQRAGRLRGEYRGRGPGDDEPSRAARPVNPRPAQPVRPQVPFRPPRSRGAAGIRPPLVEVAGRGPPADRGGPGRGRPGDRGVLVRLPQGVVPLLDDALDRRARNPADGRDPPGTGRIAPEPDGQRPARALTRGRRRSPRHPALDEAPPPAVPAALIRSRCRPF